MKKDVPRKYNGKSSPPATIPRATSSGCQFHPSPDIQESRVVAEAIEQCIIVHFDKRYRAFIDRSGKPIQGRIIVSQSGIGENYGTICEKVLLIELQQGLQISSGTRIIP